MVKENGRWVAIGFMSAGVKKDVLVKATRFLPESLVTALQKRKIHFVSPVAKHRKWLEQKLEDLKCEAAAVTPPSSMSEISKKAEP